MTKKLLLGATACFAGMTLSSIAQVLQDFEAATDGTQVIFRQPSFSGSTSSKLDLPTPNTSAVVSSGVPSGNAGAGAKSYFFNFNFNANSPLWVRLTSNAAATMPNPTIPLTAGMGLQFDIYSDTPIYASALIRETESNAAFGASGGTSGTIEFLGGNPSAVSGNRGIAVPANTWSTIFLDFSSAPAFAFTGNGVLSPGVDGKGVLEALGIATDAGNQSDISIWVDNFAVVPVPEPSVIALGVMGAFGCLAAYRRRK